MSSAFWLGLLAADILVVSGAAVASHEWGLGPNSMKSPIPAAHAELPPRDEPVADRKVIAITVSCDIEGVSRLCYAR